ncbi:TonB-dependent receptor [uncultured Tenacibaculum sp.]|uniref:SusC/RagA family TonB-linked outer membrane protein n=1 Tax=uncultured Tenacibaculum sp. TaxID=174713 RepID=UPI002610EFC9|nr:TonB-dependent receptor [uncultured Tenacibaculum sp.]
MKNSFFRKLILLSAFLLSIYGYSQTVKGVVTDNLGEVVGVNIVVKGTNIGAVTEMDGSYTINNVKPDAILVFSFVGYKTKEVSVNGRKIINVLLEEDSNNLDEVVIVGYGAKKKSLVTGAISSIDSKEIKSVSSQRVEQVLQGRTSGVTVVASSGSPGSGAKIRIRGAGSNGNSDPLFIVDGMKVANLDNLPPSDIENIEVLKDAASSAIYGTEGANGVVIVTTKTGKKGGLKVSVNSQFVSQSVRTDMKLMNASQFVTYMNEAGQTGVVNNGYDTNWIDETFVTAPMYRNDVSLSGAGEKGSYYFSASNLNQKGIVGKDNSSFKRTTFRLNLKGELTNWLEVGLNATYSITDKNGITENSDTRGVIQNMLIIDPLTPVIYPNGQVPQTVIDNATNNGVPLLLDANGNVYGYPSFSTGEVVNPVAYSNVMNSNVTDATQFLNTTYFKFKILEGLTFTTRLGLEQNTWSTVNTNYPYYVSSEAQNTTLTRSTADVESNRWLWENFATYTKEIEEHSFTALVGYSAEDTKTTTKLVDTQGVSPFVPVYRNNLVSAFGRLSYDYSGKYLLEASFRSDRSDKFPTKNKTAFFPAVSSGWVVSKENFWNEDSKIDYLKVRASWGQNGSWGNLPGNTDKTFMTSFIGGNPINYLGALGAQLTSYANDNLVWETSEQLDFGVDLKAFNNRMNFSVDYYVKTTKDLILNTGELITPGSAGFPFGAFNAGTIENKGFEFELGYGDESESGFRYDVNLNLSTLNNEVTEVLFVPEGTSIVGASAPQNNDGVTRFTKGLPVWYFYGYKTNGIDPATGQINLVDTNGDGSVNNADKTMIGSPHPDVLYGGNVSLGYKNFDFNVQFQGTIGNDIMATYHQPSRPITNKPIHFYNNRWTQAGDNASFPAAQYANTAYDTDLVVEDGSYLRIKQIQLGYRVPKSLTDKLHLNNLRVYVSLDDYFTFTNYKGLDPEIGNFGNNDIGVDRGYYPTPGKALLGLSLDF